MPDTLVAPAHLWVPEHSSTAGPEACDLAESIGLSPLPEQRLALDALMAEQPNGQWAALEAAVIASRQNLKTFCLMLSVLHDLFIRNVGLVVWTAHRFRTTQEAFTEIHGLVENYDHLRRRVRKVSTANGDEGIELLNGSRLDFLARTSGGGRGLSGDVVILDEALYLVAKMMGALFPTMSARPNPQVRYGSSAGLAESELLRGLRDRGRRGGDPSLIYVEWSSERGGCAAEDCSHEIDVEGCALDDRAKIQQANPAVGKRISWDYIAAERRALPPAEFARERLGWWDEPALVDRILPVWDDRRVDAPAEDPAAFGLDMTWDREWASIGWATASYVDLHEHRKGSGWVVEQCKALQARYPSAPVWTDPKGPAASLIQPLRDAGVRVEEVSGDEYRRACGAFHDAVTQGSLGHSDHPALDAAVAGAQVSGGSGGWVWDRKRGAVISPLVAVTHALYGATQAREPRIRVLD